MPKVEIKERSLQNTDLEMARLLAAAIVNPEFKNLLLTDPAKAIAGGFQGEDFLFTKDDLAFLTSTRAATLPDLANAILHFKPAQRPLHK